MSDVAGLAQGGRRVGRALRPVPRQPVLQRSRHSVHGEGELADPLPAAARRRRGGGGGRDSETRDMGSGERPAVQRCPDSPSLTQTHPVSPSLTQTHPDSPAQPSPARPGSVTVSDVIICSDTAPQLDRGMSRLAEQLSLILAGHCYGAGERVQREEGEGVEGGRKPSPPVRAGGAACLSKVAAVTATCRRALQISVTDSHGDIVIRKLGADQSFR